MVNAAGDNCSLKLMAMRMFVSIKIKKILVSLMRYTSLVPHNEAYFTTSGRSDTTEGK